MSFVYWLSKFSQEAILLEVFLIGLIATAYFGYLIIKKRRYGVAKKTIPDHVVRAYLMELISNAEGFKNQLFGEDFKITPGQGLKIQIEGAPASGVDAATAADLAALRTQLLGATVKQEELNKTIQQLLKDKAALEAKLAAAPAASGGAADSKVTSELKDKVGKLESRLAEYEVIEDDLANLKKYQQENKQLRAQLEALQKGGAAVELPPAIAAEQATEPAVVATPAPAPTPAPEPEPKVAAEPAVTAAPAPTPVAEPEPKVNIAAAKAEPSPIATAEEKVNQAKAAESFDELTDKVGESLTPPAPSGASVVDPIAAAQAQTQETKSAEGEPAAGGQKLEKSDADLLSEFERMLNS